MTLTTAQAYGLLERHSVYALAVCDRCGVILGAVRYTRRGDTGEWCSRKCRGDGERPAIRKGGRPRKYKTNAERQGVYRASLGVTKPPRSLEETKDLQAQKTPLSTIPLTQAENALNIGVRTCAVEAITRDNSTTGKTCQGGTTHARARALFTVFEPGVPFGSIA